MKSALCLVAACLVMVVGCSEQREQEPKVPDRFIYLDSLFAKAQKVASSVIAADDVRLDASHSGKVNGLRVVAVGGDVLEERAWIPKGVFFFWGDTDHKSVSFIREDGQEVLVVTKNEDWSLTSISVQGDDSAISWRKVGGEINLHAELQQFAQRARSSYQEL